MAAWLLVTVTDYVTAPAAASILFGHLVCHVRGSGPDGGRSSPDLGSALGAVAKKNRGGEVPEQTREPGVPDCKPGVQVQEENSSWGVEPRV